MGDSSKGLTYRGPKGWYVTMPRREDVSGFRDVDLSEAGFAGRSKSVIAFRAKRLTRRMAESGYGYHGGGLRWDVRQEGARPHGRDHRPELLRKIAVCFAGERSLEEWLALATSRGKRTPEKARAREALALVVQLLREAGFSSRAIQRALGLSASQVTRLAQNEIPNFRRVLEESFTAVSVGTVIARDGSYERVHVFHQSEIPEELGDDEVTEVLAEIRAMREELSATREDVARIANRLRGKFPDDEEIAAAIDELIASATSTSTA